MIVINDFYNISVPILIGTLMLQRYKKIDEICVFNGYKNYTFLHISIHKRCVTHYKSIGCRIFTHFLHIGKFLRFYRYL